MHNNTFCRGYLRDDFRPRIKQYKNTNTRRDPARTLYRQEKIHFQKLLCAIWAPKIARMSMALKIKKILHGIWEAAMEKEATHQYQKVFKG